MVGFEATDSASVKLLYIDRLVAHDKVVMPLPEDQSAEKSLRRTLAIRDRYLRGLAGTSGTRHRYIADVRW